jgi:hypothetical protein
MCPCSPTDVSFPPPSGPSGPPIPGFGVPFSMPGTSTPYPSSFPEDLLGILNTLHFRMPPGTLQPTLNPNYGKDVYDGIIKLLDQFMPFLMLYKFFLPILNLIICIIEVLCALMNPFALISAINRLFNQCIPDFLNLFPIFALILMIISLLMLLLTLIEYLIAQIELLVLALVRNINALTKAFQSANAASVMSIARKLSGLLCIFQNLFVLLSFFGIIIQIVKEILALTFAIPPCEGGGPGSTEGCCAATYCPTIVQNQYTRTTGSFQYLPEAGYETNISLGSGFLTSDLRSESWQLYDVDQNIAQAFYNIVDGYDISSTINPKPVFFPTDSNYSATTSPQQAAYTVNLRLYYNPISWGRIGFPQYIQFKNCIVLYAPTQDLKIYNNSEQFTKNGVFYLAGGQGYLDDGVTPLTGFQPDGVSPTSSQATLENFLHMEGEFSTNPILQPTDGYAFSDMQYTFIPNLQVLLQKNLVTLGCEPGIALSRAFVNNVMFANVATQTAALGSLVNGTGASGSPFPDPNAAQQCLLAAVAALRSNMTIEGVAEFQSMVNVCLGTLQDNTNTALSGAIGIGFSASNSNFNLSPGVQFTTQPIVVTVNLNESNGVSMTQGLSPDVANSLAQQIVSYPTFGSVSNFSYDGYQSFTAELTSPIAGSGNMTVAFQNQILCTNTLPTNGTAPSHTLQTLNYQFVYTPLSTVGLPQTGEGDTTGLPRRDGDS